MNRPQDLSAKALRRLVGLVQKALWEDRSGDDPVWNPDKSWSPDTLDTIAGYLEDRGLKPDCLGEPPQS